MKQNLKKYLLILLVILVLLTIIFKIRFVMNNNYINDYNSFDYKENGIKALNELNFYESYVAIKNYGDYYFGVKEYEKAIAKYDEALTKRMPKEKACDTKINAVLSIFQLVNLNNKEEALDYLHKAETYVDDDSECFKLPDDSKGKTDAEDLKALIEQAIYCLESGKCGSSGGRGDDDKETPPPEIDPSDINDHNDRGQEAFDNGENEHEDHDYISPNDKFW